MKHVILGMLFCLCTLLSFGGTYYVSFSGGNDANTAAQAQNMATPWKTATLVLTNLTNGVIPAGSTILFKRGDAFVIPRNFIINRALTIDCYGPGNIKPVLSGLNVVPSNGWTLKDATLGIWETTNAIVNPPSNTLNMLTVNGIPYEMGRTPNSNASNGGYLNYEAHTSSSITDNQSPFNSTYIGATAVIRVNHTNIETAPVTNVSGTTLTLNTSNFHNGFGSANGWGYFIQNSYNTLDKFGEWFYNASTKKIDICVGPLNNPSIFTVQYPSIDTAIQIQASNVYIHNVQLMGCNRYTVYNDWAGLSNITFRTCDFSYSGGDFICLLGKRYSIVDSCTGIYANSNGFMFPYHNNSVYITNCQLRNIGTSPGMLWYDQPFRTGFGVFFAQEANTTDTGLTCKNNRLTNIGYIALYFAESNHKILNNYVDTTCFVQDDGAGIYTENNGKLAFKIGPQANVLIDGNFSMHALGAAYGTNDLLTMAHGFYYDGSTNHAVSTNNLSAYNANAGIYIHDANKCRVENNVFYDNKQMGIYFQDETQGDSIYLDTVRYNTILTTNSTQIPLYMALGTSSVDSRDFSSFGIIDYNYILTPFGTNVAYLNHFGVMESYYSLSSWRSTWNYDIHSSPMPFTITGLPDILLAYNSSNVNTGKVSFPCNAYISGKNKTYINNIVLNPMSSEVLFKSYTILP